MSYIRKIPVDNEFGRAGFRRDKMLIFELKKGSTPAST